MTSKASTSERQLGGSSTFVLYGGHGVRRPPDPPPACVPRGRSGLHWPGATGASLTPFATTSASTGRRSSPPI